MPGYGVNPLDEDEEERKRRELEDWIAQQSAQNPDYLRKPPDMTFGLDEADSYKPKPDMEFTEQEGASYPDRDKNQRIMNAWNQYETSIPPPRPMADMDLSQDPEALAVGDAGRQEVDKQRDEMLAELDNPPKPDESFSLEEAGYPSMDLTDDPQALAAGTADGYEKWRNEQRPAQPPRTTAAGQQPMAAGGAPFPQGDLSSLIAPPDPEMNARWRGAEQRAIDRSGYGAEQSYGIGEGLRDFAPMAIGGLLDVLINKGKGLGYIGVEGAKANALAAKNRDERAQQAGQFALSARNHREGTKNSALDAAYKSAQIANWRAQDDRARQNIAQRERGLTLREVMQNYRLDPNDPEAVKKGQLIMELAKVDVTGLSNEAQRALQGLLTGNQALANAGPAADARNTSDLAFAGPTASAGAVGKAEGESIAAPTVAATNTALGKVTERDTQTEAFGSRYAKDNEAAIKVGIALDNIISKSKNGEPAPGLNPAQRLGSRIPGATQAFPEYFSGDVQGVLQSLDLAEEAYKRDLTGAASTVKEDANFLRQVIGAPLAKAADVQAAIERFAASNKKYLLGRAAPNPEAARKVLEATGFDIGLAPPAPAVAAPLPLPPAAPPTPTTDLQPVTGRPATLGVFGPKNRRDQPMPPLQPSAAVSGHPMQSNGGIVNAARTVPMIDPEGAEGDVPEEAVPMLEAQGYRRVPQGGVRGGR